MLCSQKHTIDTGGCQGQRNVDVGDVGEGYRTDSSSTHSVLSFPPALIKQPANLVEQQEALFHKLRSSVHGESFPRDICSSDCLREIQALKSMNSDMDMDADMDMDVDVNVNVGMNLYGGRRNESLPSSEASCISSHIAADVESHKQAQKQEGETSYPHDCGTEDEDDDMMRQSVSTPDLWNALCSLVDDDEDEDGGNAASYPRSDASTRFDAPHDTDVVSWDRMDDLMRTHEYGAWLPPSLSPSPLPAT